MNLPDGLNRACTQPRPSGMSTTVVMYTPTNCRDTKRE